MDIKREPPRVELICVSYNTPTLIRDYILGNIQVPYKNKHITIVDNCSYDKTWETIREASYIWPNELSAWQTHKNKGYGSACNDAAQLWKDKGVDYYIFMNSDVLPRHDANNNVFDDWITPLIQTFEDEDYVGVVAPKMLRPPLKPEMLAPPVDGDPDFKGSTVMGHVVLGTNAENDSLWYWNHPDGERYDKLLDGVTLSGACICIPHDLFWDVAGGFDPQYFHYEEDRDICYTLRKEGYRAVCNPKSVLYHLHKASCGDDDLLGVFHYIGNNYFNKKWKTYLKDTTRYTEHGVER